MRLASCVQTVPGKAVATVNWPILNSLVAHSERFLLTLKGKAADAFKIATCLKYFSGTQTNVTQINGTQTNSRKFSGTQINGTQTSGPKQPVAKPAICGALYVYKINLCILQLSVRQPFLGRGGGRSYRSLTGSTDTAPVAYSVSARLGCSFFGTSSSSKFSHVDWPDPCGTIKVFMFSDHRTVKPFFLLRPFSFPSVFFNFSFCIISLRM